MGQNLGQHFLADEEVITDTISASNLSAGDTVLEIGPGKGVLTEKLLEQDITVIAVEKDPELADKLQNRFKQQIANGSLTVITGDIRDYDLSKLINDEAYKVIANIPYYLTSELIQKLLLTDKQPSDITLLIQKEVAQRITAADGKHSRMSLFVHAYGKPKIARPVQASSFTPPPNVDSAILVIDNISHDFFTDINADDFFDLTRIGFQHKRKTIRNNLKKQFSAVSDVLDACEIDEQTRPEQLTLKQWQCLYRQLN